MKQRGTGRKCAKKRWGLELPMRWMIGASEAVVRLAKKKKAQKKGVRWTLVQHQAPGGQYV